MIFPIQPNELKRDPFDPAQRIDREIGERGRRLVIGIYVEPDYRRLTGALLVVAGNGKYLRPVRSVTCAKTLPDVTTSILRKLATDAEPSLLDVEAVQGDIAAIQSAMVEELKRQAGKYVERLLAVALLEPGIRVQVDQQRTHLLQISNPDMVAEITGISVIDAFANRDISCGGTGAGLTALPAWLMFADRAPKLASRNRLVVTFGDQADGYFIPASDGSDVELPEIRVASTAGLKRLQNVAIDMAKLEQDGFEASLARLSVDGRYDPKLAVRLTNESLQPNPDEKNVSSAGDLARTAIVSIVADLSQQIKEQIGASTVHEIVVDSHPDLLGAFINQIERVWTDAKVELNFSGFDSTTVGCLNAVLAGMLGAMSIDQMPANIPWITGAHNQRILGRMTPGSPSNWRQLLREMADFQPPAMRLRDAV